MYYKGLGLNYVTGVINREDQARFKRMIIRITRGNHYTVFDEEEQKVVGKKENEKVIKSY